MKAKGENNRSLLLLGALLAICLLTANIWAISQMLASQRVVADASEELSKNTLLIAEIKRLQFKPRIASLEQETITGIPERIEQAMQFAGITSDKFVQNIPGGAAPKGNTNYKERLTEIKLKELTMPQIVQFCQQLEAPEKGLTVRDLDLRASIPVVGSDADLWEATIQLSQLIYSESL